MPEFNVEVLTEIVSVKRLLNSASGNPRWALVTRTGTYRTAMDANCNYGVKDYVDPDAPQQVRLTLSGQGLVVGIEYLS